MQTVHDFNRLGYQLHDRLKLQHGRTADWEGQGLPKDAYLPAQAGVLHDLRGKNVDREAARQAEAAIREGQVMLLTAADFLTSPPVVSYKVERSNEIRTGGPGGYPYQPERIVPTSQRSLEDLAREITGHPMAAWAIRPQVGAWPDSPELFLFTPVGDGTGPLSAEDVMTMMEGRRLEEHPAGIEVAEGEVLIGSIRLDRKTYLVRLPG